MRNLREAVELSYSSGQTVDDVAHGLGISRSVMNRWRREAKELGQQAFPGHGVQKLSPLEEENLRLRRELAIVLNGEIYNYRELKKELTGFHGVVQSELDVVKALYREHGIKAIAMLEGMFALAILDGENACGPGPTFPGSGAATLKNRPNTGPTSQAGGSSTATAGTTCTTTGRQNRRRERVR